MKCAANGGVFDRNAGAHPSRWLGTEDPDLLKSVLTVPRKWLTPGTLTDSDVLLRATRVSVWGRWFVWLLCLFQLAYRPDLWYPEEIEYLALPVLLFMINGLVHYQLMVKRSVTWQWILFLSTMDLALITCGIVIGGGFKSFIFLAYYPALAFFAVVFSSLWHTLAWTTTAAIAYSLICLMVAPGLDLDAGNEKVLVGRLAVMYTLVIGISFITRFERTRWRSSASRERQLQEERIEFSQRIHDTTAQTAYMIGLGIHRARELADDSNQELIAALDVTSELSRSAMWELRRPIDAGHIFEGRELRRVLLSHCRSFETISGVHTEMSYSGTEPPLARKTRSGLFSIAHNALTNAFLHAHPGRVEVGLSFEAGQVRMSVSDDGVGLPDDYAERGRGFDGMMKEAEQMGGSLIVESGEGAGGTTITCAVPYKADQIGG